MDVEVDGILVAAHELKEPLATLRQLALSFDEMGSENEAIRDKMVSVSERAIRQVNDLMKLRRLEGSELEMGPVAVRPVCDAVMRELEYLFRYNQRELFVKYVGREQLVSANRELLSSVIYNFLLNAVHDDNDGKQVVCAGQPDDRLVDGADVHQPAVDVTGLVAGEHDLPQYGHGHTGGHGRGIQDQGEDGTGQFGHIGQGPG